MPTYIFTISLLLVGPWEHQKYRSEPWDIILLDLEIGNHFKFSTLLLSIFFFFLWFSFSHFFFFFLKTVFFHVTILLCHPLNWDYWSMPPHRSLHECLTLLFTLALSLQFSHLSLPNRWDHRHVLPCLAFKLDWESDPDLPYGPSL